MKVKLFRRGKFVGLVNADFHKNKGPVEDLFWQDLELPDLFV